MLVAPFTSNLTSLEGNQPSIVSIYSARISFLTALVYQERCTVSATELFCKSCAKPRKLEMKEFDLSEVWYFPSSISPACCLFFSATRWIWSFTRDKNLKLYISESTHSRFPKKKSRGRRERSEREKDKEIKCSCLVERPLNQAGAKRPFFFVNFLRGSTTMYRACHLWRLFLQLGWVGTERDLALYVNGEPLSNDK